jgi:hypothetical protein
MHRRVAIVASFFTAAMYLATVAADAKKLPTQIGDADEQPFTVTSCRVDDDIATADDGTKQPQITILVAFKNIGAKPLAKLRVVVANQDANGTVVKTGPKNDTTYEYIDVTLKGTLKTDATASIAKSFLGYGEGVASALCVPAAAIFTDGTTWKADALGDAAIGLQ